MQTVRYALHNAARVFHRKNILVVFVVLFLIPFLNIGVASGYVGSIAVPEFIMDFIKGNVHLLLLFSGVLMGLGALLLRWMYAFHYFTLERCGFKEARKRSAALSGKNKIKDFVALVGVQLSLSVLFFVLAMLGVGLAVFLGRVFSGLKLVQHCANNSEYSTCYLHQYRVVVSQQCHRIASFLRLVLTQISGTVFHCYLGNAVLVGIVSASVVWVYLAVSLLVLSAFGTPISYACISILFYAHKEDRQEEIIHGEADRYQEKENRRKIRYAAEGVILLGAVVCCCFYLYGIYNHKVSVQIEYVRTMEVTAHRGASARYPENTMAAFEGAKELGADWIELDVQQSRDGQIFVMHDTNFMRTAGVDSNTWEMDYDEIRTLDVGSFFDSRFAGERVPLLSEVIAFAKENGIKLNIEMKPTGHEHEFEQKVAEIIATDKFADRCVVTSQVYDVLEKMKACDSRIQTVYVMSIAYGDINVLTAADHFSIEASNVTEKLVSDVHNAGKEIYAWTVNTEENINRMIDLNVDNIITDDITQAKECIYLSKTSDVVSEYVKWLSK